MLQYCMTYLFMYTTGVQPHVHVLLPGPGIGHPASSQRLATQGRYCVSGVRGVVRRRVGRQQVQTAAGRAAHHTVSSRTTSMRRHCYGRRHGRDRCHHGNRRHAVTHDLDVNKQRCDNFITYIIVFRFSSSLSLSISLSRNLYLYLILFFVRPSACCVTCVYIIIFRVSMCI